MKLWYFLRWLSYCKKSNIVANIVSTNHTQVQRLPFPFLWTLPLLCTCHSCSWLQLWVFLINHEFTVFPCLVYYLYTISHLSTTSLLISVLLPSALSPASMLRGASFYPIRYKYKAICSYKWPGLLWRKCFWIINTCCMLTVDTAKYKNQTSWQNKNMETELIFQLTNQYVCTKIHVQEGVNPALAPTQINISSSFHQIMKVSSRMQRSIHVHVFESSLCFENADYSWQGWM